MERKNKFTYLFVVQGYYDAYHGWEDLTQSESRQEARQDLRAYRNEYPQPHRIIQRRELNS